MAKAKNLSRGNTAVAQEAPASNDTLLVEIPITELKPWPGLNPRTQFDPEKLAELAVSIRTQGLRQPIGVHRPAGDSWSVGLIVFGERRWRAAREAGLARVPCLVREYSEEEALEIAIIENLQRDDLKPIEEARGFAAWLAAAGGRTQTALAERIGKKQATISNTLRLLDLPEEILELVDTGSVPVRVARDLLLPFAKIPEQPRAKLFRDVAKLLAAGAGEGLPPEQLRQRIGTIAAKLSRPLGNAQVYGIDQETALFPDKRHAECTCRGPEFEYPYTHGAKVTRCFDLAWWDAEQTRAKEKAAETEKRRLQRAAAAAAAGADAGVRLMEYDAFSRAFSYNDHQQLTAEPYGHLFDPGLLPVSGVIVVRERGELGNHKVHAVDLAAFRKAKGAVTREQNQLRKTLREEYARKDIEAAARLSLDADLLRELMVRRPDSQAFVDVARDLGIESLKGSGYQVYDQLRALPQEQLLLLAKVIAIRGRDGRIAYPDPLDKKVQTELGKKYTPLIRAYLERVIAQAKGEAEASTTAVGRAGQAKKVPAGQVETPQQKLELRFQHLREASEQLDATIREELSGGAQEAALQQLERRLKALLTFIRLHNAVCITDADRGESTLFYSISDKQLLEVTEACLQAMREPAEVPQPDVALAPEVVEIAAPADVGEAVGDAVGEAPTVNPVEAEIADLMLEGEDAVVYRGLRTLPVSDPDFKSPLRVGKPRVLREVLRAVVDDKSEKARVRALKKQLEKQGASVDLEAIRV